MRRVVTRAIGLVPSMAVAIAAGRNGIDTMLVASQVALSIVLPFIVFPLLYFTSSKVIMSVKKPLVTSDSTSERDRKATLGLLHRATDIVGSSSAELDTAILADLEGAFEIVDYSNPKIVSAIGWLIWLVVLAANIYAIVTLALGQT